MQAIGQSSPIRLINARHIPPPLPISQSLSRLKTSGDSWGTLVTVPDAPRHIGSGANATLQIIYTADFDKPENQAFYACSDITYVLESAFSTTIPCFNATEPPSGSGATPGSGNASALAKPKSSPGARSRALSSDRSRFPSSFGG